jgi:hypothetical protein
LEPEVFDIDGNGLEQCNEENNNHTNTQRKSADGTGIQFSTSFESRHGGMLSHPAGDLAYLWPRKFGIITDWK